MLLEFLKEIERQREQEEMQNAVNELGPKVIPVSSLIDLPSIQINADPCQVCKTLAHKYTCPKCKLLYCTLNCYKAHSANCVEEFCKE
jgi:hypothetical protein